MKKIRVLAVDDNKNLIEMMKEYFKDSADIEITLKAHDGSEGLRLIEKKQDEKITQRDISKKCKLSLGNVNKVLAELQEQELVKPTKEPTRQTRVTMPQKRNHKTNQQDRQGGAEKDEFGIILDTRQHKKMCLPCIFFAKKSKRKQNFNICVV